MQCTRLRNVDGWPGSFASVTQVRGTLNPEWMAMEGLWAQQPRATAHSSTSGQLRVCVFAVHRGVWSPDVCPLCGRQGCKCIHGKS
eukprot:scaffold35527_cov35-Prasinocladus_malaysianus.AAC.2